MDRMMSREEVAGILGVSPSYLNELVKSGAFPPPISLGKTNRTNRWPARIVQNWLAKQEGIIYGKRSDRVASSDEIVNQSVPYFTGQDIAKFFGTHSSKIFSALVAKGLLLEDADEYSHYRPTEVGFQSGFFWRIEKFSMRDKKHYFQTVFTAYGKDDLITLVREALKTR